jgi:putative transposase
VSFTGGHHPICLLVIASLQRHPRDPSSDFLRLHHDRAFRRQEDASLRTRIREIAESKRRYGCPRIYIRLRREGWPVNHKKVERIYYRDEGLSLRRRRRKKLAAVPRVALPPPSQPGRCYAMDFVHDRLVTGRRFKCLTMTDPWSKEVPVSEVDVSIGGTRVCRILDRLFLTRPLPETLILDNGPEFAGTALDAWAAQHGVHLHCIQPGKPVQNAFIESFNGKFGMSVSTSTGF